MSHRGKAEARTIQELLFTPPEEYSAEEHYKMMGWYQTMSEKQLAEARRMTRRNTRMLYATIGMTVFNLGYIISEIIRFFY